MHKFHALASPRLWVRLFKVVFDILLGLLGVLIDVVLGDRNVWQNQNGENMRQIFLDELLVLRDRSTVSQVPYNSKHQSFALSACSDRTRHDHRPNMLEESVLILLEVLGELWLVQVHKSYNFSPCFAEENLVFLQGKLWELCLEHYRASASDRVKIFLIKIRELLLT